MRVLYVIDSLVGGGAESSLAEVAPFLRDLEIELHIGYLHERPGLHDRLRAGGATLHPLSGSGGRLGWIRRTRSAVRELRPDLVHTTLFEADVAGRIAAWSTRTPVVSSLVNAAYGPEHYNDPQIRRSRMAAAQAVDIATARVVDRFHAITDYVADIMAARLHISRRKVEVVPRGRDPRRLGTRSRERTARARSSLGLDAGDVLILAVARQEHQKGLDILLEAFARVRAHNPNALLVIAGREGNQTRTLLDLQARLGLLDAARFLGARTDVFDLMSAADVFVCPSRWEGLGSVLLEAMALEAPIVASDLPPIREVVSEPDTAILVPPESPHELHEAIERVIVAHDEAAVRARAARRRFEEVFNIERIARQTVGFYERSLTSRTYR